MFPNPQVGGAMKQEIIVLHPLCSYCEGVILLNLGGTNPIIITKEDKILYFCDEICRSYFMKGQLR